MFPLRDPDANADDDAPRGRREQKRLDTRRALNDAAVELFATKGYEHTTVDDLCREANVSLRTFFRYFESKDDVLFAREMDIAPFLAAIRAVSPEVPPLEAFRRAYLAQPRISAADAAQAVRFQRAMASSTALQGQYVVGMEYFRGEVAHALAAREGRRTATDEDLLAATVGQATLDHAYRRWLDRDGRGDLRPIVERSFDLAAGLCTSLTTAAPDGV
ncbi:MAG TPA: TetR family transcriptional regulator [Acidimicrobiia bacterium]|jgi:AcrR family transcriptional regulator